MPFQPGILFSAILLVLCLGINLTYYPKVRGMFHEPTDKAIALSSEPSSSEYSEQLVLNRNKTDSIPLPSLPQNKKNSTPSSVPAPATPVKTSKVNKPIRLDPLPAPPPEQPKVQEKTVQTFEKKSDTFTFISSSTLPSETKPDKPKTEVNVTKSEKNEIEPKQSKLLQSKPSQLEPLQSEPKQSEPKKPESKQLESKQPESNQPKPKQLESKQPESSQPKPKQLESKQPESSQPKPKQLESKQSELNQPKPKQSEPKQPELKQSEPKQSAFSAPTVLPLPSLDETYFLREDKKSAVSSKSSIPVSDTEIKKKTENIVQNVQNIQNNQSNQNKLTANPESAFLPIVPFPLAKEYWESDNRNVNQLAILQPSPKMPMLKDSVLKPSQPTPAYANAYREPKPSVLPSNLPLQEKSDPAEKSNPVEKPKPKPPTFIWETIDSALERPLMYENP
jgi:hypothetical protein